MVVGDGPQQVQDACEAAVTLLVGSVPVSATSGSRAQWAAAVGAVQEVLNVAAGLQDAAIARLAAIEAQWCEDGTEVETHRALGHVALDAPAILSGVLNVAAVHAERRVSAAVRLAADGPAGSGTESGLGALHAAMTAGLLDPYRAGVIAEELAYAPAEVAQAVVTALAPYLGVEDGTRLRRRCRRVLARISPDLLLQRAKRARSQCGLRRWAEEPGVDRWEGTFPSEDAARAWAAIDALAHRYVTDGVCESIEQARGKALTDLVTSNATIETVITLTVPATASAVTEPATSPVTNSAHAAAEPTEDEKASTELAGPAEADRLVEEAGQSAPLATTPAGAAAGPARSQTPGVELVDRAAETRDGDLVEVAGLLGTQPVLVPRGWVTTTLNLQRDDDPPTVITAKCHPVTGALLDPDHPDHPDPDHPDSGPGEGLAGGDVYRPPARLARLIRARDRRCRPGCTVAAVFCDLDHVRAWPAGPTTATNLLCLCRRHHRVKQRPGWHLTLHPDGQATWTDPTGAVRTTDPIDALHPLVLPDTSGEPADPEDTDSTSTARTVLSDGPHSDLEFTLEHHAAALPRTATTTWRGHHGRRHHTDLNPATDLLDPDPDDKPRADQTRSDDPHGYRHPAHDHHSPNRSDRADRHDPWARWRRTHTTRRPPTAHRDTDPPPF